MSYVFYNPNPDGKMVGDCVIRALTLAMGLDWEEVYVDLSMQGFAMHDMPNSNSVWGEYLKLNGFTRHVIPDTCPDCYSIQQFCIDHPEGVFVAATGSHVVAIVDGNYYDTGDSGREVPVYYWQKET